MTEPSRARSSIRERPRKLPADAMRALAHPLRLRILDELSINGPLTASGLGERLAESSGATSYHLRQLEKHGLVREVTAKGNARERWWERRPGRCRLPSRRNSRPGSAERLATQLIENEWNRPARDPFPRVHRRGQERLRPGMGRREHGRHDQPPPHSRAAAPARATTSTTCSGSTSTPTRPPRPRVRGRSRSTSTRSPWCAETRPPNEPGKTSGNVGGREKNS